MRGGRADRDEDYLAVDGLQRVVPAEAGEAGEV